uniref:Endothelin-converting enzyme 1 n=1 Tax=Strigamia maritima TaxID=126957 RepID=T1IPQ3_STRMM
MKLRFHDNWRAKIITQDSVNGVYLALALEKDFLWLTSENEDLEDVCLTKECVISASRILENLDLTVNPCDDFYKFSCGGFSERILAYDYKTLHVDSEQDRTMIAQLKKLMQRPKTSFTGSRYKLKDMYDSCLNIAYMKELGLKPLKDLLNYYGGWPMMLGSKWKENKFNWKKTVSEMIGDAVPANLIRYSFEYNHGHLNSDMHVIPVIKVPESQPQSLRNTSVVNDTFVNPLIEIAVLLGASREEAQQEMEEVYSFRSSLNDILDFKSNETDNQICLTGYENAENLNTTTVEELYSITDKIDWLSFLRRAFSPLLTMQSEIICIAGSSDNFGRLIDAYDNTSKRVLANYLFSGLARNYMQYIKSAQWDNSIMNSRTGYIPHLPMSRWRICLPIAHKYFLPVVTSIFVRHNYKSHEKQNLTEMFLSVQREFRNVLESVKWLTSETLEKSKQQIDDLIAFLAHADEILDDKNVEEYYRDVPISPYEFLKNILQLQKFQHKKNAEFIDRPVVRKDWNWDHMIKIPVSQARESYFTMNRPHALNYGSLGAIMGHEILHAVNQIGVPKRPEVPIKKWWTDDDEVAFRKRAQCTINQYGRYGLPRKGKLNGTKTLDENVADNTGVLISYRAYQSWLKDHPADTEARLPGLDFNSNQLFWMSYANSWCFSYPFASHFQHFSQMVHSWAVFRVWGTVSNSPDFAKDFNCPSNSPMNPENKCSFLIIGDFGVGKTAIIRRFTQGKFSPYYKLTIGVDFAIKSLKWTDKTQINLQLWDIAGHERFGYMTRVYYKYAAAAVIVFDLSRPATFDSVMKWYSDIREKVSLQSGEPVPVLLLANKCDIPGIRIDNSIISQFCRQNNILGWYITSAKDDININLREHVNIFAKLLGEAMNFLVKKLVYLEVPRPQLRIKDTFQLQDTDNKKIRNRCGC